MLLLYVDCSAAFNCQVTEHTTYLVWPNSEMTNCIGGKPKRLYYIHMGKPNNRFARHALLCYGSSREGSGYPLDVINDSNKATQKLRLSAYLRSVRIPGECFL